MNMLKKMEEKKPRYYLDSNGDFIIENYNYAKPFANFFPGIAGKYGIPMWVFYVNRGQAIASFGTKDKDHAIMEFFPANKSWQLSSLLGFRTFIKVAVNNQKLFYEPFHNGFINLAYKLTNRMKISSYDLRLEEENLSLGLNLTVEYFTIPNDSYSALVRLVTISNTSKLTKKIQLLDGLPQIVPFGMNNFLLKELSRTIEAWMTVKNLNKGGAFYKLEVDPADKPEVVQIHEGNFYLAFHYQNQKPVLIKPIVEPEIIFGPVTDFTCPYHFISGDKFKYPKELTTYSKTPCGFLYLDLELPANTRKTFVSLVGYMRSQEALNNLTPRILKTGYLEKKSLENKVVIEELQQDINTESSSREFNLYAKQTYLDNILRGGYPLTFRSGTKNSIFYVYSRKHGDLERDYNKFSLQPNYLSQGNANYRDINQNRRMDNWFNPRVQEENIITFFNLLQTDGFNPLVIKGVNFTLKDKAGFTAELKNLINQDDSADLLSFLSKPFHPGELIFFIQDRKIKLKKSYDEFLGALFSYCQKHQEAEHGEGFWTDHWTYNLDLLENYLNIYPENSKAIIFEKKQFSYFDNSEVVRPRFEKYILYNGFARQLHALTVDNAKKELIKKRSELQHTVRVNYGTGEIYQTTLINKLLCLVVNKLSSLDPFGVGIEMEANKPNWYDALNGLPALFGSSSCETFELKRLIIFINEACKKSGAERVKVSEEVYELLTGLNKLISEYFNKDLDGRDYEYWDKSNSLKENYRHKTLLGVSGQEIEITVNDLLLFLTNALQKINLGLEKALDQETGLYYSYFINEVREYDLLKNNFIRPTKFIQKAIPFFLESQVHALRVSVDLNKAKKLYQAVKKSSLYDEKLKMYKVSSSLAGSPQEIGRCCIFTPGWLEHESIWLHMEYKYILELLKAGLYEEFYAEFKNLLIPFQKPEKYGRSILENSSFIVSSVYPDKSLQGTGFVARLSGSTAEFLQIWALMNIGKEPFFLNERNELSLRLAPVLPAWLFTKNKTYAFNFLSKIRLTYHNQKRKNTFGKGGVSPKKVIFKDKDNKPVEIASSIISYPYAQQIRARLVNQIDVYLE